MNEVQTEIASDEAIRAELREPYQDIEGGRFSAEEWGYGYGGSDWRTAVAAQDRLLALRGRIGEPRCIALEAPIVAEWRRRWQELEVQRAEAGIWRDLGAGDFKEGAFVIVRGLLQQSKSWLELLPWVEAGEAMLADTSMQMTAAKTNMVVVMGILSDDLMVTLCCTCLPAGQHAQGAELGDDAVDPQDRRHRRRPRQRHRRRGVHRRLRALAEPDRTEGARVQALALRV